jgi:hypothetical protein
MSLFPPGCYGIFNLLIRKSAFLLCRSVLAPGNADELLRKIACYKQPSAFLQVSTAFHLFVINVRE